MSGEVFGKTLTGRRAVVTGGHAGIGYYITEALLAEGMQVAILGRRRDRLDAAARNLGGAAVPVVCDISDPDSVRAAFAEIDGRLGSVDVLINNAAVFPIFTIGDATDQELETVVRTNLLGVLYCTREAIVRMRKAGGGDILTISSESVQRPFPYLTAYAATKSAVETLSRGLKSELRPHGIRVGVLRSGFVAVPDREPSAWDPDRAAAFFEQAQAGGHLADSGPGIAPQTTARSIVHMLRQPDDAAIDLLELRGR
jgi:meso-butanediol dehydrogenase / (S,S)-butanediol dehydrogenase / diacetyl reductase